MSRKTPSFGQLIDYFDQGQAGNNDGIFIRNLYSDVMDRGAVKQAFLANHSYLPKHSNGNVLYHEIITLEPGSKISAKRETAILLELAERYCAARAPGQLVFGQVHNDRDHRHIHLMISSNAVRSSKRVRLTKGRFSEIQQEVESHLLRQYPELEATPIYTRAGEQQHQKISSREAAQEQRTQKPSRKRQIGQILEQAFSQATSQKDLYNRLEAHDFQLYHRGTHIGVEPLKEGRRFRLKTLGLESAYQHCLTRIEQAQERENALRQTRTPRIEELHTQASPAISTQIYPADPRATELLRQRKAVEQRLEQDLQNAERD